MGTYDQMIDDNRYPGEFDNENYLFSKQQQQQQQQISNKDDDGNASLGRRVYLESPSFGNKEEEDLYRYVPSRITDRTSSIIGSTIPTRTGPTLTDPIDFDYDILGTNKTRSEVPYQQLSKPVVPTRQLSNMPRVDPRQDPLLGPLLAELDAMSNQQQLPPVSSPLSYHQNSVPYESNFVRPVGASPSNHAITNIANRTVNDALLEAELYDSFNLKDQKLPLSSSNLNSLYQSRPLNMNGTDIFEPSSYATGDPGSFLSHFGPDDQLFQRPLLNTLGQNYVPNIRPPQQRDISYDQIHNRVSPPQRTTYVPPNLPRNHINEQIIPSSNPFIEYQRSPPQVNSSHNQEMFFTDHNDDQLEQQISPRGGDQQEQDSRRQAVWNDLQRSNAKVQEKNSKKHESTNRNKAPFGSTITWNGSGSQQSSAQPKSPQRPFHHPPPISKSNYIEDNIDMINNKEDFYHRYPGRKYENLYSKRKDLHTGNENDKQEKLPKHSLQRKTSLPLTVNLNTGENSQSGPYPGTFSIPLDSHVNRVGDKISVNIDLRLTDLQHLQQQQQGRDNPDWSSGDPLDRHIRKLERNIDQSLPTVNQPQRSPVTSNTGGNPSAGRQGKQTTGIGRGGYNPPSIYGGDYYNYSNKGREEDSYLSKLNQTRKNPQFKPYTGRDYEQFKKNYGFGTGHLGYDFDNTTHKEKSEKLAKTRQYAQQIDARNKKKISGVARRTLSDTRLPKAPRSLEYPPSATRLKQFSGKSTYSSPAILNELVPFIPAHRPTEVLYRPAPSQRQLSKLSQYENKEFVEQDKVSISKNSLSPSPKRREVRLVQGQPIQRRLSPPKNLPPIGNNQRRPIRFDNEPIPSSPQQQQSNVNQIENRDNDKKMIREVINERPLNSNEELDIVED